MPRSYYIFKSGRLRRKDNTLYLEAEGEEEARRPIPVEDVRDIYVFGELEVNCRLLSFLSQHGVVVHFFNHYGYYCGSFYPREVNVSGQLLVNQVEHYLDPSKRLFIASELVKGAIFQIKANLGYYSRKKEDLDRLVQEMDEISQEVETARTVEGLMGAEGRARELYYSAFDRIMELDEPFRRVKHPPDNWINAMISFGNSLLYAAVLSEIYVIQLNPTVSYLHEPSTRRFSLALDLSEPFKPLLVDRLVFRMVNRREISPSDFEDVGEAKGVYMREEACKRFVREFEEGLQVTVKHRTLKRPVSYRHMLRLEGYKLIRHLMGMESYRAFRMWW